MSNILLSVVLAIHNEENNLDRCLNSVVNLADEIIIVDGESTDKSLKIALKHNAKIISTTNKQNFHINKQIAIDAATGHLVLQLDADEVVDQELYQFISDLKSNLSPEKLSEFHPKAWWIIRKNWYLGRFLTKGGQYPDKVIRLMIRGYARLPQKDVHEQMEVDGKVGECVGHLLHYSFPNFQTVTAKMNTYTSFQAKVFFEKDQNISPGFVVNSFLLWPLQTFLNIFIRHKGFVDSIQGFVFALISALHHPVTALKLWELEIQEKK